MCNADVAAASARDIADMKKIIGTLASCGTDVSTENNRD